MKKILAALVVGVVLPIWTVSAQGTKQSVPPGTPVTITVTPTPSSTPDVSIRLLDRHGHAVPLRECFAHTGGGNVIVDQPSPDTVVVTMTGVAVAGGHPCKPSVAAFDFDLKQFFEVVFEKSSVKAAKATLEARVIGLLRSHCKGGGSAEESNGCVAIMAGDAPLLRLCTPHHAVSGGENLSINDRSGPAWVPILAQKYILHQIFHVAATHPKGLFCKASSAEFAPDPGLDPLWISYWEPFHGAQKKDFGFQVTLKVAPVEVKEQNGNGKDKPEDKDEKKESKDKDDKKAEEKNDKKDGKDKDDKKAEEKNDKKDGKDEKKNAKDKDDKKDTNTAPTRLPPPKS